MLKWDTIYILIHLISRILLNKKYIFLTVLWRNLWETLYASRLLLWKRVGSVDFQRCSLSSIDFLHWQPVNQVIGWFVFPPINNTSSGLIERLIYLLHITMCRAEPSVFQDVSRFNVRLCGGWNEHKKGARVLNCSLLCIACTNRLTNLNACTNTHTHTHTHTSPLTLAVTLCPSRPLSFPALEITSKRAGSLEERGSGIQLQRSSWEGPTGGADTPPPVTLSP